MRVLVIVVWIGLVAATHKPYDGDVVVDVTTYTRSQGIFLHELMLEDVQLDFWDEKIVIGKPTRIRLPRSHLGQFKGYLADEGLTYEVAIADIQKLVDIERAEIEERALKRGKVFDIDDFNTLDDINAWLAQKQTECAGLNLICTWNSIGKSVENRDINLFTITANASNPPIIYMDSLTHAREWLTPATLLKFVDNFLTTYGTDPDLTHFLDAYQWDLVAVVNPDGYEFSWIEEERLWRKNRALNENYNSSCMGVDLNRNHDFRWGWNGVSFLACSEVFLGPDPSSEPETQVIEAHITSIATTCFTMITLHSYGYYWLHPWGNTLAPFNDSAPCDLADDHEDLYRGATAAADAAMKSGSRPWTYGSSCQAIYASTGATDDWSKGVAGIKYSYNPELRGNSFIIAPSEIEVSYQEIKAALVALVADIEAKT